DEATRLLERLALHGCAHHRRGGLADGTTLAGDLHVGDRVGVVVDLDEEDDLVAAQRVETLHLVRGRNGQLAAVPGRAVVVEDDLSVEVFESGHRCGSYVSVRV